MDTNETSTASMDNHIVMRLHSVGKSINDARYIEKHGIQWNLYKWGSMGRAKLELAPFPGYNLYYEVLIYYLIASLFGVLIN